MKAKPYDDYEASTIPDNMLLATAETLQFKPCLSSNKGHAVSTCYLVGH